MVTVSGLALGLWLGLELTLPKWVGHDLRVRVRDRFMVNPNPTQVGLTKGITIEEVRVCVYPNSTQVGKS